MLAAAVAALVLALAPPPTVRVWDDQLASDATPAQIRFVATHEAGSQKLTRSQIAAYKAVNPAFKVLQYRLAIGLGRHTQIIDGNHWVPEWPAHVQEQWFTHVHGSREYLKQWGWYLTNPDDVSWQRFFIAQLERQVAHTGAWGLFLDSASVPNEFGGSAWSPPLPDLDPSFEHAWSKKLDRWLPLVQQRVGKPVIANVGSWVTTRDVTDYSHIAGVMIEGFGAGLAPGDWLLQQQRAWSLARRGKIVIAQSYPQDAQDRLFDVASYLLVQGTQTYMNIQTSLEPEWWPEYEVSLGRPTGVAVHGAAYSYRDFQRGRVLVNPGDAPVTVKISGELVVAHGGGLLTAAGTTDATLSTQPVTSVTLAPRSGAVVYE
ncbi:MAG TPA: putative glycoside hydrolase [Gaiellaceae bacterium]|nr:putative glycoside hydrolase [Gaiellaceae bacterium]